MLLVIMFVLVTNINVLAQRSEVVQASKSDLVVIGVIENIEEIPGSVNEMFHTIVSVNIDTTLIGESFETCFIMLQSGPVTDGRNGGVRIKVSNEPNFRIGQRIVLFLKNSENNPYLNSGYVKENFIIPDFPNNYFWAGNNQVFEVRNDSVYYFGKVIKEDDFINKIKQVRE